MIEKVINYVKEQQMLEEGDCVVAGVSGGADSVCLLFMLLEIRKSIPIELKVVHVNHLIREDAANDAAYVRSLCKEHDIPFTLVEEDVEALAARLHSSTEEVGRNVRYQAFEKTLDGQKGKIAVAHNRNDSCETFLFNLFRGSSLKGLSGISPVRNKIIRPLLCLERSEIEAFLQERNIPYCIDRTNLEDNYTRNRIRHHILETAVQEVSPLAVRHIASACDRIREAYDLIEDIMQQAFHKSVHVVENAYHIEEKAFCQLHKTIQSYVIMEVLTRVAGSRKDLQAPHIRQVQELMEKQCGKWVKLPYQICAKRDYTGICVYKQQKEMQILAQHKERILEDEEKSRLLAGEELEILLNKHSVLQMKIVPKEIFYIDYKNIPQKKYTKLLDYDKIKDNIVIRTRKEGDYLTVNSINQRKTLKAYFIDNKVPQKEREHWWLVAEGSHVIWAIGGRISNYYKVSEKTKHILQLTYRDVLSTDCSSDMVRVEKETKEE